MSSLYNLFDPPPEAQPRARSGLAREASVGGKDEGQKEEPAEERGQGEIDEKGVSQSSVSANLTSAEDVSTGRTASLSASASSQPMSPRTANRFEEYSVALNDEPRARRGSRLRDSQHVKGRGRVSQLRANPEQQLFERRKSSIVDLFSITRPRRGSVARPSGLEEEGGEEAEALPVGEEEQEEDMAAEEQETEGEQMPGRPSVTPSTEEQRTKDADKLKRAYSVQQTAVGSFRTDLADSIKQATAKDPNMARMVDEEEEEMDLLGESAVHRQAGRNFTSRFRLGFMRLQHSMRTTNFLLLFLAMLGIMMGVLSVFIDLVVPQLLRLHRVFTYATPFWALQFFFWCLFLYVLLAAAMLITRYVSLNAMGSGIPEMKSIMSGVTLLEYLSVRTLIAKISSLTLALGGGIVVGKEGPFVHLASILANQMFRFPLFFNIRHSPPLRHMIFNCAIAAGVAANFGAPIGGLLFSIEVTSTYYPVRTYFYSAWCSVVSGYVFRVLSNLILGVQPFRALVPTNFGDEVVGVFGLLDIGIASFLGILAGVISPLFVFLHLLVVRGRRRGARRLWLFRSVWPYSMAVGTLTAVLTFPRLIGPFMGLSGVTALRELFSAGSLPSQWTVLTSWVSLPLYAMSQFYLTAFSISLPIPTGLFVPILTVGAALGRFVGDLAVFILPVGDAALSTPGVSAVVGAVALVAGVTQTFSSAVIIFELTGQLVLLIPVTLATIISIAVSRGLTYSIYDGILQSRNLPYLPDIPSNDIMDTSIVSSGQYLTVNSTYRELAQHVAEASVKVFPVVEGHERKVLLGIATRKRVKKLLFDYRHDQLSQFAEAEEAKIKSGATWHNSWVADHIYSLRKSFKPFGTRRGGGDSVRQGEGDSLPGEDPMSQGTVQHEGRSRLFPPDFHEGRIHVPYEHSPIQLQPSTSITSIHLLFITMRLQSSFVTQDGRLLGVISRNDLRRVIHEEAIFDSLVEMV